jgi:hypothetical protein
MVWALAVLLPGQALAQGLKITPGDVALTPADLPEGFQVDPSFTGQQNIEVGVGYTVGLKREPSPENLAAGPTHVWQYIVRIDRRATPTDFFGRMRDDLISAEKLEPFPGGLNDGTISQLLGETDEDGHERLVFAVGRLRDNMIWYTLVSGDFPATTIQSAITLNDQAIAKYERFRTAGGAPAIANLVFIQPFTTEELPPGFMAGNIVQSDVSERALAHNAFAEIDLQVRGPGPENLITFITYPSEVHAQASFDEAPARALDRGSVLSMPDGYGYPVLCAMRSGDVDGRKLGATSCLALVGSVEVSAFSVLRDAEFGSMSDALNLMSAGVKHLQRILAASSGT